MRCADCKHWDRGSTWERENGRRGCDIINGGHALAEVDAFFTDGGHAVLVTGADFGCVLFERKEPA